MAEFDALGNLGLAYSHVNSGNFELAITVFDCVLNQVPLDHAALMGRGSALAMLQRFDAADVDFSAVLRIKPEEGDGWKRRGQVRANSGRIPEAISDLSTAMGLVLSVGGELGEIRYERGCCHRALKDWGTAKTDFEVAIAEAPQDNKPYPKPHSNTNGGHVVMPVSVSNVMSVAGVSNGAMLAGARNVRGETGERRCRVVPIPRNNTKRPNYDALIRARD